MLLKTPIPGIPDGSAKFCLRDFLGKKMPNTRNWDFWAKPSKILKFVGSRKNLGSPRLSPSLLLRQKYLEIKISAKSRIGSLENRNYTPKGGNKQIETAPIKLGHVKSKCGSLDNISKGSKWAKIGTIRSLFCNLKIRGQRVESYKIFEPYQPLAAGWKCQNRQQ